jgi:hypothetical protein
VVAGCSERGILVAGASIGGVSMRQAERWTCSTEVRERCWTGDGRHGGCKVVSE